MESKLTSNKHLKIEDQKIPKYLDIFFFRNQTEL